MWAVTFNICIPAIEGLENLRRGGGSKSYFCGGSYVDAFDH